MGTPSTGRLLMIAGSGSSERFLHRAFGPGAEARGLRLVPVALRSAEPQAEAFDFLTRACPGGDDLVGGVSLGAHLAARWLAAAGLDDDQAPALIAALPAWSGPPTELASLTAQSADRIEEHGVATALELLYADTPAGHPRRWVVDELAEAWPTYGESLAEVLRACSLVSGPTQVELGRIRRTATVIALTDDPMHPHAVAQHWAASLPSARLVRTDLGTVGADRGSLGRLALST